MPGMGFETSKLIVKALHAVEDAAWLAQRGPVDPSFALRFALAFLFAHGDGQRDSFDEFWRVVTEPGDLHQHSEHMTNICRSGSANRAVYGIYRAVGVYRSTEMMFHSALARKKAENVKKRGQNDEDSKTATV